MDFAELNHPLGLRCLPLSYAQYAKLTYEIFSNKSTLVFVDTNVLGLPFRFHGEARKGFFGLLNIALKEKRLYVPGWTSNEFFHRSFKSTSNGSHGFGQSAELINKLPKREKVLGLLRKVASDEDLEKIASALGSSKEEALAKVGDLAHSWNDAVSKVGADLDPEVVHGELLTEFENCFLALDFNQHCSVVHQHADRRRANRIPPGLSDGAKADSDKRGRDVGNVDGDLALWLEILSNAETIEKHGDEEGVSSIFSCVLILTEEKKEDFSYAPKKRHIDEGIKAKTTVIPNTEPRVLLIDPRLVSEFESRLKHRNVAFVNIESLAQGWQIVNDSASGGEDIRAFARSLMQQGEITSSKDNETDDTGESLPVPDSGTNTPETSSAATEGGEIKNSSAPAVDEGLNIPAPAANDEKKFIEGLAAVPSADAIESLNSHNWYVQNPAVLKLISQGVPDDIGIAFVTGRALYQAAHGNAWRAESYINKFEEICITAHDNEQALLAGMAYETLFDSHGMRRQNPKIRNAHHIFSILASDKWIKAREWILAQMDASLTSFYWKPGQTYPKIIVELSGSYRDKVFDVEKGVLKSSGFKDVAVFEKQKSSALNGSHTIDDVEDLKRWISEHTLVPVEHVNVTPSNLSSIELHSDLAQDRYAIYRAHRVN